MRSSEKRDLDKIRSILKKYPKCFPEEHLESYLTYFKACKNTFFRDYNGLYKTPDIDIMAFFGDEMYTKIETFLKGNIDDIKLFLPKDWKIIVKGAYGILSTGTESYPLSPEVSQTLVLTYLAKPAIEIFNQASLSDALSQGEKDEFKNQEERIQKEMGRLPVIGRLRSHKTFSVLSKDKEEAKKISKFLDFIDQQYSAGVLFRNFDEDWINFSEALKKYRGVLEATTTSYNNDQETLKNIVLGIHIIGMQLQELMETHTKNIQIIPEQTILKKNSVLKVIVPQPDASFQKTITLSHQNLLATSIIIKNLTKFSNKYSPLMIELICKLKEEQTEETLQSLVILSSIGKELTQLNTRISQILETDSSKEKK